MTKIITFGDEQVFNVGPCYRSVTAKLSDSVYVVHYVPTTDYYSYAVVATISGTSVSYGTPVLTSTQPISITVCTLTPTTCALGAVNEDGTQAWNTVGTVSGTDISIGPLYTAYTGTGYGYTTQVTSSDFLYVYTDDINNQAYVKIGTVSGLAITFGDAVAVDYYADNLTEALTVTVLSSTVAVVSYYRTSSQFLYSKILTISGTTITLSVETDYALNGTATYQPAISSVALGLTSFAVMGADNLYICSFSGTVITVQNTSPISGISTRRNYTNCLTALSTTDFLAVQYDTESFYGYITYISLSGYTPSMDTPVLITGSSNSVVNFLNVTANSNSQAIIMYQDYTTPNYSNIVVLNLTDVGKKWNGITITKWNGISITKLNEI